MSSRLILTSFGALDCTTRLNCCTSGTLHATTDIAWANCSIFMFLFVSFPWRMGWVPCGSRCDTCMLQMIVLTGREPGTLHKLGIGAFAGLVAQSCTYPLEVVRRRMQTYGMVDTHAGVREVRDVYVSCVLSSRRNGTMSQTHSQTFLDS